MISSDHCSQPCGDDGVFAWVPAALPNAIPEIACHRFACPLTHITVTQPNATTQMLPDKPIFIEWVGGSERDRYFVEYLSPDCSEFIFLGLTSATNFTWNPPFHEFHHPDFYGDTAYTRFRVSLESNPTEYTAISVIPLPIPVVIHTKSWHMLLADSTGAPSAVPGDLAVGEVELWGALVNNVWGPLSLQDNAFYIDEEAMLSTGYPQGVYLSFNSAVASDRVKYVILQPADSVAGAANVDTMIFEVPERCYAPGCIDRRIPLPCALFSAPTVLIESPFFDIKSRKGKIWMCSEESFTSRPAIDLTAPANNDYCASDVGSIRALPFLNGDRTEEKTEGFRAATEEGSGSLSGGAIAAIVVGSLVACCMCVSFVAIVGFGLLRHSAKQQQAASRPVGMASTSRSHLHGHRRTRSGTRRRSMSTSPVRGEEPRVYGF
jgi:hypothetical protein